MGSEVLKNGRLRDVARLIDIGAMAPTLSSFFRIRAPNPDFRPFFTRVNPCLRYSYAAAKKESGFYANLCYFRLSLVEGLPILFWGSRLQV